MTKCKCLCHKEVPSGTIRAFSHIEDCLHMTKDWKEELKEIEGKDYRTHKYFISNLIEQVIEDIPYDEFEFENMETLKQQLRDKYL